MLMSVSSPSSTISSRGENPRYASSALGRWRWQGINLAQRQRAVDETTGEKVADVVIRSNPADRKQRGNIVTSKTDVLESDCAGWRRFAPYPNYGKKNTRGR